MIRMFSRPLSVALLGSALFGLFSVPARAQTYILTDTTLDGSSSITSDLVIGQDSTGTVNTSPTVNIPGGYSGSPFLASYNSSHILLTGGRINDSYLHGATTFDVIAGNLTNHIYSYDNSTVNFSGGALALDLDAYGTSHVNFTGGSIGQNLQARENSVYHFSGGSVARGSLFTDNSASFISGGSFGQNVGANFIMENNSMLTLIGSDLTITDLGPDPGFGERFALGGRLLDGTDLTNYRLLKEDGFTGAVTLVNVPEPGNIALLTGVSLTGTALLRRRKRDRGIACRRLSRKCVCERRGR